MAVYGNQINIITDERPLPKSQATVPLQRQRQVRPERAPTGLPGHPHIQSWIGVLPLFQSFSIPHVTKPAASQGRRQNGGKQASLNTSAEFWPTQSLSLCKHDMEHPEASNCFYNKTWIRHQKEVEEPRPSPFPRTSD